MSEIINNSRLRVDKIKELILSLHKGISVETTKEKLSELMGSVPYGEVVQAEQELIQEGLPQEEVIKYCDLHSAALKGNINKDTAKSIPPGHPVDTFQKENTEITIVIKKLRHLFNGIIKDKNEIQIAETLLIIQQQFNMLQDLEKHYLRKENLLFPFLENNNITGPPVVMWAKHDEVRQFLKSSFAVFGSSEEMDKDALTGTIELLFEPTINAIDEMIFKEESILFPMAMDALTELEWYEIYKQSIEIGFCLYDPDTKWKPDGVVESEDRFYETGRVQLSTGSFKMDELEAIFKALPFDLTFVDKNDKVRYFSHGKDRIFARTRSILGRQVQHCHPPQSVHIVNQIVDDFRSCRQNEATFWINLKDMMVFIAYYAVRNDEGEFLGTLEVTQNISGLRKLEGERRLLQYDN